MSKYFAKIKILVLAVGCIFTFPAIGGAQEASTLEIKRLAILQNGHVAIDFELRMPEPVSNGRISVFRNIPGTLFYGEVWRNDLSLPRVFHASVTDNGANANLRSEAFFVVAFDHLGRTIAASTAHRTQFLRLPQPDLCFNAFILVWENYQITTSVGVPVLLPVPFDTVEVQISTDGALFTSISQIPHPMPGAPPQQSRTATLEPGRYFFRVRASDDATGKQSFSNVQMVDFYPPQIESFAIDFVDVLQNREIIAGFSAAGDVDMFRFGIWRSTGNGAPFVQIATMNYPGAWTDTPDLNAGAWFYKVTAHHKDIVCPQPAFTTEPVSSLFLEVVPGSARNELELKWQHQPASDKHYHYILHQRMNGFWTEIARMSDAVEPSFSFKPDRGLLGIEWVFKAEAAPVAIVSRPVTSNYAFMEVIRPVLIPNAFRPNSQIAENRIFLPLFVGFVPVEYHLVIFDRSGHPIFSTTNPGQGWDGSSQSGLAAPGVYSFLLRYRDAAGVMQQQQGTVALVE